MALECDLPAHQYGLGKPRVHRFRKEEFPCHLTSLESLLGQDGMELLRLTQHIEIDPLEDDDIHQRLKGHIDFRNIKPGVVLNHKYSR